MPSQNGSFIFREKYLWKPRRVEDTAQLKRLITISQYSKLRHLSRSGVMNRIQGGKVWATKIGSGIWIDPSKDTE
ncbi:MAG: hypothetical protein RLZZ511_1926 [Cyanobacteriota bacterium]|jgi:hypothetical protein